LELLENGGDIVKDKGLTVEVCEEGNDKTEVQANGFDDGGGEYNPPG
jgi:hypothetical protein